MPSGPPVVLSIAGFDPSSGAGVTADIKTLAAPNGESKVQYDYSLRGLLRSVSSSYGTLISSMTYNVDGTPKVVTYGDKAKTTVQFAYDDHDVVNYKVSRTPPPLSG